VISNIFTAIGLLVFYFAFEFGYATSHQETSCNQVYKNNICGEDNISNTRLRRSSETISDNSAADYCSSSSNRYFIFPV